MAALPCPIISQLKKNETPFTLEYLLQGLVPFLSDSICPRGDLSAAERSILAHDQVTVGFWYSAMCLEGKDVKRDLVKVFCNAGEMWNAVLLLRKTRLAVPAIDPHI